MNGELSTDPAVLIGQHGKPVNAVFVTLQFEPVHHSTGIPKRAGCVMRPIGLPCHNVLQAVTIDICELERVHFREHQSVLIFIRLFAHDQVLDKTPFTRRLDLLIPSKPILMSREACDDVLVSIPIDVVGVHVRPARAGKWDGEKFPFIPFCLGLLVPAVFAQNVRAAIAIDVPSPQAMAKRIRSNGVRDFFKRPRFEWILIRNACETVVASLGENQFRPRIANKIDKLR